MSVLENIIYKEEKRNEMMINKYISELKLLPKGKIMKKTINNKIYYYLCFRDGKKVTSLYLGKNENEIAKIQESLIRRNQIEEIIKKLEEEKVKIKKMEAAL